jgi:beta-mannosidase
MPRSASQDPPASTAERARVHGHELQLIDEGWEAARSTDGDRSAPDRLEDLVWIPARVPGTVAAALRDAGEESGDLDAQEWWFRTRFDAVAPESGEEMVLRLDGLATLADVFLNGELVLRSTSMFARHSIDIGTRVRGRTELAIRFRALRPEFGMQRRPRARWRTRLVPDNSLRWFRTMLLGRIPSFSPGPAAVGPWRPIWIERRRGLAVEALAIETRLDGDDGIVAVRTRLRVLDGHLDGPVVLEVDGPSGPHRASLGTSLEGGRISAGGELRIASVERWWPHTHGLPVTYAARLLIGTAPQVVVEGGRVGFRTLAPGPPGHEIERDGLSLLVNDVPIFVRGALWTPLDLVSLSASGEELRAALESVMAAGMNMLRVPGFGPYEQGMFHDLCDDLGILVWQDLMFASMDYPFENDDFARIASAEVEDVAARLAGRPSTVVLCGNSEVEQQVAMLGLDIGIARIPFYDTVVPTLLGAAGLDAVYVPSSPFGGALPMRPSRGVTNYYGVGGYRGPLSDARTSGVLFAAECLAFANIPDDEALATLVPEPPGEAFTHHPRWKAGVARDPGAGWDFDDVRDHYLALVFGVDPSGLRRDNWDRYLELSRAVTGEVMAHVFGEWRRTASPCNGGMILWLRDLVAGAGYGVVDHLGRPKTPYHYLRRSLAPTAVWLVDEGIGGVIAHVANDGPTALSGRLRVSLYSDLELRVGGGEERLELPPHGSAERDIETVIGRFVDAAWAYRFGPPAQDAIVVSLLRDLEQGSELLSQAFHFPAGRPMTLEPERRLGLSASVAGDPDGTVRLTVATRRLAYGVRIHVPGFAPSDDAFSIEPGGARTVTLRPALAREPVNGGWITALNLLGRVAIRTSVGPA